MESAEQLSEKINSELAAGRIELPALPEIALRVSKAVNDENKNLRDLAILIQADQSITARVIQISNSPLYRNAQKVTDCFSAISKLGMKTTRDLVICLVMHNMFSTTQTTIRKKLECLWLESSHVASISSVLARKIPTLNVDTALLAGLVHNIGAIPVLHYIGGFTDIAANSKLIEVILKNVAASLGSKILLKWGFDDELLKIPENADSFQHINTNNVDYLDVVIVAKLHSLFGTQQSQQLPKLVNIPAFNKLGLSQEGAEASMLVLQQAKDDIVVVRKMLALV